MWPHERSLVQKMEAKPFALIGINTNGYKPDKLKDVMDKEKLNWRSFSDPGSYQSGVAKRWNLRGTPTLFVLDHKGVIRYKWLGSPGEKAIDAALEKLVKEAEGGKGSSK
jgi:peroxiredoxin